MPFPRGQRILYDSGTRMPLAIRWPTGKIAAGWVTRRNSPTHPISRRHFSKPRDSSRFRNDRATVSQDLLTTGKPEGRDTVFLERERHANVREGDLKIIPAVRSARASSSTSATSHPTAGQAGDPARWKSVGPFGDIDGKPLERCRAVWREDEKNIIPKFFKLACEKRLSEELYDLKKDPDQLGERRRIARVRRSEERPARKTRQIPSRNTRSARAGMDGCV